MKYKPPTVETIANVRTLIAQTCAPSFIGGLRERPSLGLLGAVRIAEGGAFMLGRVARIVRRTESRHPLAYRADQLARQIDELVADLRREATK